VSPPQLPADTEDLIRNALERMRRGRLGRRDFIELVVQWGLSTTAAATLAGVNVATKAAGQVPRNAGGQPRPNIVLILADDMGFGDLGVMGSEIRTPNIDSIAHRGVLLSSMYNAARCCPSRAALLTGLYPHKAGIGHMGANLGTRAYQGYLRKDAATIAEILRPAGYRTLMAGKWHVGGDYWARRVDTWKVGDDEHPTPRQRGFDRFYGIIDGTINYFSPWYIMEDDRRVEVSPTDYYFTDAISDKAIAMIEESTKDEKPFFLYLAHAAPHWPLQAPEANIAKYEGAYREGWDALRGTRYEEMQKRGILQHRWNLSPRDAGAPAWPDAKHQLWESQRMQVYAAQIDRMDQQIGRVLDTLRRLGQLDNTLVLFLSDNGGCAEFMREEGWAQFYPDVTNAGQKMTLGNRPDLRPGGPLTFMSYELPWANVSNTPFRLFKHYVHEGGISTPLLVQWPARISKGGISQSPCHITDVMPTILEAAGVPYPNELASNAIQRPDGESLLPLLEGRRWARQQPIYWEHEGNAAARVGNFKLVRKFQKPWELYDMETDRTELHDLSKGNQAMLKKLTAAYEGWAQAIGVVDWNLLKPKLLKAWQMSDTEG
jgi:arylsulfatase A-like enzyme